MGTMARMGTPDESFRKDGSTAELTGEIFFVQKAGLFSFVSGCTGWLQTRLRDDAESQHHRQQPWRR